MVTKQRYIHFKLDADLCLSFHVHNRVENIFKHVLFNVHDIMIMVETIGLPIRKLPENTLMYPIMDQTKTNYVNGVCVRN